MRDIVGALLQDRSRRIGHLRRRLGLPSVPPPPCGAISPRLGATVADLRALGLFERPRSDGNRKPPRARPPRPLHRLCVCELGHEGEYHRSEDGQVWHRDDSWTREQLVEADRRRREVIVRVFSVVDDRPVSIVDEEQG